MKKLLALLLAALLCFAVGCSDGNSAPSTSAGIDDTTAAKPVATAAPAPSADAPATDAPNTDAPTTDAPATAAPATDAPATEAPATEAPATEPAIVPVTEAEPLNPWSLLDESLLEQGTYTDALGYSNTYSYALPCIRADTPGAQEINAEIDRVFGEGIREANRSMEDGLSVALDHVGYRGEVWEDVLTLVVIAHWEWDYTDYGIYCYDTLTGQRLDTPALLEKLGLSQEDFLTTCRAQFRQCFVDLYGSIPEEDRTTYGYYAALDRCESEEFVNLELQAYPVEGDLVVAAPIPSLAGADFYFHLIYLGLGGEG